MTVSYSAASLREVLLGAESVASAVALPTAAQSPFTLYTVTGGRIMVVGLIGQVSTAIGATSPQTLKLSSSASAAGSSVVDLCVGSPDISSAVVGTNLCLPSVPGVQMIVDTSLSGFIFNQLNAIIPPGVITLTSNNTNTGKIDWDLFFIPIDSTAVVTPA
jgi:hypothetical protein